MGLCSVHVSVRVAVIDDYRHFNTCFTILSWISDFIGKEFVGKSRSSVH